MKILGLIPARGKSKGVPRKNIKLLQGKELIRYTIETGLACPYIDQLIVSTDDPEIARISQLAGADVPFLRPDHLAGDQSPTIDTVVHALRFFENRQEAFDAVCLLQPTVPFRDQNELNAAIKHFLDQEADSLISVRSVPAKYNPHWIYVKDTKSGLLKMMIESDAPIPRRQDLPEVYHRDGSVYLTKSVVVLSQNSLYGASILPYRMTVSPDINIDTPEDWAAAELFAGSYLNAADE